MTGLDNKKPKP